MPIDIVAVLRGLAVVTSLGLGVGACSEPLQNGGVVVFGGASARFDAMCRFRRGADGQQTSCVAPAADVARATAARIDTDAQRLQGPRAEGVVGDVLLTNGEISIAFGGAASGKPGVMLDVVDAHVGQDELASLGSCVAEGTDCLAMAPPQFGQERDGSAWVEVRLAEPKPFDARTRYTLFPGARSLLITTVVTSQSPEPLSLSRIGDVVSWGSSQQTVPPGETPAFVAAVGADVAYAIMPADDRSGFAVDVLDGSTFVRHARDVVVSAAHPIQRDRVFVVAPRGDTLGVLTEVSLMRDGQAPGAIEVRFIQVDGALLQPQAGGRIRLVSPALPIDGFWSIGAALESPTVTAEAPPGRYVLEFEGSGRRSVARVPVEVRSGEVVQTMLVLEADQPVAPVP